MLPPAALSTPSEVTPGPWVGPLRPSLAGCVRRVLLLPSRIFAHRDFVVTCVGRDLRARFRGSTLGFLWPLLQPLCIFAVYGFLFAELLGLRMPGTAASGTAYGVYLFTGALVWSSIAEAITRATTCVKESRNLVQKLSFPCELLPLNPVLSSAVTLGFGVAAYVLLTLVTGIWTAPGVDLLWIPALLAAQLAFTYGVAMFVAAANVIARDTEHAVAVLLTLAMFATPVFWVPSIEALPALERWMPLVDANPLHHLLQAWRGVLMGGEPAACFTSTPAEALSRFVPWSVFAFLLGSSVFALAERRFPDEV